MPIARRAQLPWSHWSGGATVLGPAIAACSYIYYYYYFIIILLFFSMFLALLGPLTCSKTLETLHKHIGIRGHQGRAEAGTRARQGGSTAPSWTGSENFVHISNALAHISMKLGTHIDLIGPNNFRALSYTPAQQEVSYYGLFEKCMFLNLIYSS